VKLHNYVEKRAFPDVSSTNYNKIASRVIIEDISFFLMGT
jgi:hypothetical protein